MSALGKFDFTITVFLLCCALQIRFGDSQVFSEYDCTGNISGVCRLPEDCMHDCMYKCPIPGSTCCPEVIGNSTTDDLSEEQEDGDSDDDFDDQMGNNKTRLAWGASDCQRRPGCERRGGYCVSSKYECNGKFMKKLCKGSKCFCCIPTNIPDPCPVTGNIEAPCNAPQSCAGYDGYLDGVYEICPLSNCPPVLVRCLGYGWTVVLYRNLTLNDRCNFARDWNEYKSGFCNPQGEYWIGNDVMAYLTSGSNKNYEMEITGYTSSGDTRTLRYYSFWVNSENDLYRLYVSNYDSYSSTGVDLFENPQNFNIGLNGFFFTTYDSDNDNLAGGNCCSRTGRGGFWYNNCAGIVATKNRDIEWYFWNPDVIGPEKLDRLYMMIKPY